MIVVSCDGVMPLVTHFKYGRIWIKYDIVLIADIGSVA